MGSGIRSIWDKVRNCDHNYVNRQCTKCGWVKFCDCTPDFECAFHARGGYTTHEDELKEPVMRQEKP